MDKISLLQARRQQLAEAGKKVRTDISSLVDKDSFVELSCYSFSKNEFYDEAALGEGVVTGFATVCDYSFFIVAQNQEVFSGGISKANCDKIAKCLEQAEKSSTPVIWLLSSSGVRIEEGVGALEGLAKIILKASRLKGSVPQFLVVNGETYGQITALAGICDFNYFIKGKSVLAAGSPLVISAKSCKNLKKTEVGGAAALGCANLATFEVDNFEDIRRSISKIAELLSTPVTDSDELNEVFEMLDTNATADELIKIFDADSAVEIGSGYSPEVRCFLARTGGIAIAATVFSETGGVQLNALNIRKIKDFAEFASFYGIPYVTFVNTLGIKADLAVNNSIVLKEIGEYVSVLDCIDAAKISVIYGKAIGLGYTLFAAKSMGYDYSYAFANAEIALFDSVQGAEIEYSADKSREKAELGQKYLNEVSDPFFAAKDGYIDNIIQPANVKKYLIASLQMLAKRGKYE